MPRKSEFDAIPGVKFRPFWSQVANAPRSPDDGDAEATPSDRDVERWEAAYEDREPGGNRRRTSAVRWSRRRHRRSEDG
jgi:hypothetical protein